MRIVYILFKSQGGIPHYTAGLANAVSEYADVTVIKPSVTTADDFFSDRINIINAFRPAPLSFVDVYKGTAFSFKTIIGLLSHINLKVVKDLKPDIIHFPDNILPHVKLLIKLFKLDEKYPLVVTFHAVSRISCGIFLLPGKALLSGEPFSNIIAANVVNLLDILAPEVRLVKVVVHTKKNRMALIERGMRPEKIAVIPLGTFSFFKNYGSCRLEEEENTILFFGNIVASKAIDVLIDAMPMVINEIPNVKLIIAGDGLIPKRSWSIIEKYRYAFEVHNYFITNEKVGEFFARASLVVIPNRRQEGHSATLTVAYSFGKPVITTNVGEFPELVSDAGCGLTVPPENPKALAEAIVKLLKDPALRREMGRNALRKAEELSWSNIAKMHMKVYGEVLDEWRKRNKD
ncbi:MAG: glycosyltransferase family 4 protein [Candidatus Micrarchaeota archaeon]|nr:glycosyltransferase family 4 protein [Candidatus Micrarchaeota archaeon]